MPSEPEPRLRVLYGVNGEGMGHATRSEVVIRSLLEDGRVPVDARDNNGGTALWSACKCGYTERARALLVEGRADHTIADETGETLMAAAQRGEMDEGCVQLLQVRGDQCCVLPPQTGSWSGGVQGRAEMVRHSRALFTVEPITPSAAA